MSFFHTKSVAQLHADSENSNLSKDLGVMDLTFLGVGGIIGAGIFVLTGIAAAKYAGPAISISFALAGLLCILVGLAYSEFASMIPSSGSVYSYTFASLGEGMAFLTGWQCRCRRLFRLPGGHPQIVRLYHPGSSLKDPG